MNSKMATEAAKVIYGKRKTIVEPVFGQIKNSGFVASVCEVKKKSPVNFQWSVLHTIQKNCQGIVTGLIRPEFGNFTTSLQYR